MGVVKRIVGWRDSRWPIPNTLQALVGLVEPRDPEAYLERKRADREAARERVAIQEERRGTVPRRMGPSVRSVSLDEMRAEILPAREITRERDAAAGPTLESMRAEVALEHDRYVEAFRSAVRSYLRGEKPAGVEPKSVELPARAQPGWYRFDRTFYRVGQGPFPTWGFPEPKRTPATVQGSLF